MSDHSAIEWTDATWNPTTGCDRISPGCTNCYALTLSRRLKAMGSAKYQTDGNPRTSGPGFGVTMHEDVLTQPLRWRRPRKVFVDSMSDLGHAHVDRDFLVKVFAVMVAARLHTFQVLTKRPRRLERLLAEEGFRAGVLHGASAHSGGSTFEAWPPPNVWIGTSVESDDYCWRADSLRQTAAALRFLSLEPLLGPLPSLDLTGVDWVIVGGESGPGARPMRPEWALAIQDSCRTAAVPLWFKQAGSVLAGQWGCRHSKGGDPAEWPILLPRQFPAVPPSSQLTVATTR